MDSATVRASDKSLRTRRAGETMLVQQNRPRGLIGQMMAALLQPGMFFRGLAASGQWLIVAVLVLALTGAAAVRQAALISEAASSDNGGAPASDVAGPPVDGGFSGGPGGPIDGGIPPDVGTPGADPAATGETVGTWTTALVASGTVLLGWVIQMILLCEVSLFRGRAPALGQNLRIAVWASLPLALMAGLQLAYYAAGGSVGQAGLVGYVGEVPQYAEQPPFVQALIISAASRATVFWLWSALLLFFGARYALGGQWLPSVLVVLMWLAVLIVVPVATGAIKAPEVVPTEMDINGAQVSPDGGSPLSPGEISGEGGEAQPASPARPPMKG